ncbi:tubby C-terminal domain-like protein [Paenibacillus harenae]
MFKYDRGLTRTEWLKAELEIEAASPIQEPEFFVALFHCIFYIGD